MMGGAEWACVCRCRLMQKLRPGSIARINEKPSSFAISDNINSFLRAAREYGLRQENLFELTDLTERHNIARVASTVDALAALVSPSDASPSD